MSIVRTNEKGVARKLAEALEAIGYAPKKDKIFIKPNLCIAARSGSGVVTHYKVVEALVDYFSGREIVIGDGPTAWSTFEEIVRLAGYAKMAQRRGVKLVDLEKAERVPVRWRYGELMLPKLLTTHEYINVPVMKTHATARVTLAIKNQKGLLLLRDKKFFHRTALNECILALYEVVKPDLVVVDGTTCLEGNGPFAYGRAKRMNLLICGTDAVEVDNVCCRIMGFEDIPHIPSLKRVETVGLSIEEVRSPFLPPGPYIRIANTYIHNAIESCTLCQVNLSRAFNELILRSPRKLLKWLSWGGLRRLDVMLGRPKALPEGHGRVLCIGSCAAEFAREKGLPVAVGCPPSPQDIVELL